MESTLVVHHHFPPPLQLHCRNPPNFTARFCLGITSKLQSSTNGRPHSSPFTRSPSTTGTAESSTSSWSPKYDNNELYRSINQYILHTSELHNISLPFACRHGCCTSCVVRIKEGIKEGKIKQPEALGISAELKSKGYALLCVGFPSSDLKVETLDEDEVYWLQFGRYFARGPIERDDYALERAMADE